jgi:phage-related protein
MVAPQNLKPIEWMGSTKKDLSNSPDEVKDTIGFALYLAQCGQKHESAKPLKGFGSAKILEIVEDDGDGTWRAVYTVEFARVIYVLDFFKKKSTKGIGTPKHIIDRIKRRLRDARAIERNRAK